MPTIQTKGALQALLCFAFALSSQAQPGQPDTPLSPAAARAAVYYQSYIASDAAIYNGCAYQPDYLGLEGSPYFLSDNLTPGTLVYEDLPYTHLLLLYNTVLDQPVLADREGRLLTLQKEKVSRFTMDDHTFIHLETGYIPTGYYELLHPGQVTLLIRHTKKIEEKLGGEVHRYITARDNYYVCKKAHYYPVGSTEGLIDLLSDKKQQLQQYRRSQHIRFRKDPVAALEKLIDYYNQLSH